MAYKTKLELKDCLDSLGQQVYKNFEVIVVDNDFENINMLERYSIKYYRLGKNYGPSYARNYGAKKARGNLLAFLDDDATADKNWTQSIFNIFQDQSIAVIRGKLMPKSNNIYTFMSKTYDLGESVLDSPLTLEGNSAVRRKDFLNVGGFDPKLFGHEGIDLSYRLVNHGRQLYIPDAVIYHDSADNLKHYLKREVRQGYNGSLLSHKYPEIIVYAKQFTYSSKVRNKFRLSMRQRLQMIVIRALSIGAYRAGSLLFRAHVIFLKKEPTTHTKY